MRPIDIDQPFSFRNGPGFAPRPSGGGFGARRPLPVAHALLGGLLVLGRIFEALAVAAAGLTVPVITGTVAPQPLAIAAVTLVAVNLLSILGLHGAERAYGGLRQAVAAALVTLAAVPLAAHGVAWLSGGHAVGAIDWAALAAAAVAVFRLIWGLALDRLGRWTAAARRVLVVGDRERALDVLSLLAGGGRRWAFPVGVCLDRDAPERPAMGGFIAGLPDAERIVREEGVDDVVVALPWSDGQRLADCLEVLRPLTVDVHLFPEASEPFVEGHAVSLLSGVPMAKVGSRPLSGMRAAVKAVEDRLLAALILAALSPLMLLIAVAIKLDSPGPVLFRQQRYGYDNQPFTCMKFRSMVARAPDPDVRQATRRDPRVTRVGRFLRRSSLDELPQLFNVLGGSMSLVGPRPHAVSHHHYYARLVDDYRCRHRMKPGLTGWAQVNGYRGETNTVEMMRKRVLHDLWYIDHWSPWLDLAILARTPGACIKGTNAY